MTRYTISVAAIGLAAFLTIPGARAQNVTLDVAVWHNEPSAWTHAYKWWEAEVDKRTQGRVKLRGVYSGALAKANEVFKAVRDGAVPVGVTSAAAVSGQMPALAYIEALAGMSAEIDGHLKVVAELRPVLDEMFSRQRVKYLWIQPSYGGTVNCRERHLKTLDDWKNLKVRTAGRWQAQQIQELGAKPTALDPAEQYIALQNKTLDCVLSNHEITFALKLYEPSPKIVDLRVPVNILLYLAHPRTWERISEADRKVIETASIEAERIAANHLHPLQKELQAKIRAAGGDVHVLTDAERAAFIAGIYPTFAKMDAESGADGVRIRKILEPSWR
ncbi:MAG: hypothetical protein FJX67_06880 [Alphaproteobacteria bacterium]|nr:hypothetical protein [Alphaproteobacteria bacterium]